MREQLPSGFIYPLVITHQEDPWKGHHSERKAIHEAACVDAGEVKVRDHPVRYAHSMLKEKA